MPISGDEYRGFRVFLLGLVGVMGILSLAGIVLLGALDRPIPPVLAVGFGGVLGSLTTLLTPVRRE